MKIALPIETKVREFRGKLWLALNLVSQGHKVTIGNISSINNGLDVIEPDIYFGDSAYYRPAREKLYREIQQNGGKVVVLDTEGGVFRSDKEYTKRLSPQILEYVDHFCAWGSRPGEIAAQEEQIPEKKIHITGNPRFDLLHSDLRNIYRPDAEDYQDSHGNYILVNTNFTIANPFDPDRLETTNKDKIMYQDELWSKFIEAIKYISKNIKEYVFIVRPHPSEDHGWYRNEFQSCERVKVIHEGDVRSWIYDATATLHNSCTTGIESALMGTPVFSYRPIKNQDYDLELPNVVSSEISEQTKLHITIKNIQPGEEYRMSTDQKESLQKYFYNIEERSVSRIMSVIENTDLASSTGEFSDRASPKQLVKRAGIYLFGIHTTEQALERLTHRDYSYMRQKFPGLSSDEIQNEARKFRTHTQVPRVSIKQKQTLGDVFTLSVTSAECYESGN